MEKAVVIINDAPSSMRAWNGLRLAVALIGADMKPELFLLNDGVFCAMKDQKTPDELAGQHTAHKIEELQSMGGVVKLCTQCAQTRGISDSECVEGLEWVSIVDLAKAIRDSAKVVSF